MARSTVYRGYDIRPTPSGNYYVPAFGASQQAANLETAKRWIDMAIASGELKRRD